MVEGNCTHYWLINEKDIGRCKYCPAVRDFGKELRKWWSKEAGERVARGKRGRPRKVSLKGEFV